jgi:hypothetical protein
MVYTRVLLALTAALAAVAFPSAAMPAVASTPVVYQAADTSPDTPGAPDIASVTVSDSAAGLLTFQISFVPGTEHQVGDSYNVYVDSDQNPTTGDISGAGADYLLQYDGGESGGLGLYKWDGKSSYAPVAKTSLQGSFSADSQYFVISASELGISDGFNFNAAAAVGADPGTSQAVDFVPENGTNFHYAMQNRVTTAVKLSIADWQANTPRRGKYFATELAVKRSDTGALLTSGGTISCALSIRGGSLPVLVHKFLKVSWYSGGSKTAAVCAWRIPVGAVGATATAKETVALGTSTISKSFAYRVKK